MEAVLVWPERIQERVEGMRWTAWGLLSECHAGRSKDSSIYSKWQESCEHFEEGWDAVI